MNIIFKKLKIKELLFSVENWTIPNSNVKGDFILFEIDETHIIKVNFNYVVKIFGVTVSIFKKTDSGGFTEEFIVSNNYYFLSSPFLILKLYKVRKLLNGLKKSEDAREIMSKMPQSLIRDQDLDNLID